MTGPEAIAALPITVRIGPFDFAIKKMSTHVAAGRQQFGEFSCISFEISIQEDIPSAAKAVDTFLHEVLHGIYWSYGFEDEDKEERIVGNMATALTALYRDNPWLSAWISKALSDNAPRLGLVDEPHAG